MTNTTILGAFSFQGDAAATPFAPRLGETFFVRSCWRGGAVVSEICDADARLDPPGGDIGPDAALWCSSIDAVPQLPRFTRVAVATCGRLDNVPALRRRLVASGSSAAEAGAAEMLADLITLFVDRGVAPDALLHEALVHVHGAFAVIALLAKDGMPVLLGAQCGAPLQLAYDQFGAALSNVPHTLHPDAAKRVSLERGDAVCIAAAGLTLVDAHGMHMVRRAPQWQATPARAPAACDATP